MELIYPWILAIGVPLLIIGIIWKMKKPDIYKSGKKVANTKYIENMPYYKKMVKRYKVLSYLIKGICSLCILLSLILLARPASVETIDPSQYNRDIFLCMDISGSVRDLDIEILKKFEEIVKGLKGERIGITIFDSSAVVLVPLTDDYNYLLDTLSELRSSLEASDNGDYSSMTYYMAGTMENNDRGTSLIGDGLASCVYNFSNLEEKRSRSIIFSTDNRANGEQIFTLSEAAELSKNKGITVYGFGTETVDEEEEFESAMKLTGGDLYKSGSLTTVSDIIDKIQQKEKNLVKGQKQTIKTDIPQIPFVILIISVLVLFILSKKVKI